MNNDRLELTEQRVAELMVNNHGPKETVKYITRRMVKSYASAATALRAGNTEAAVVEFGRWNELLIQLTYVTGNEDAMNELEAAGKLPEKK